LAFIPAWSFSDIKPLPFFLITAQGEMLSLNAGCPQHRRGRKFGMEVIMRRYAIFIYVGTAFFLASCATQPSPRVSDAPGFFLGLVHGFFVLVSLIGSLFWDTRIYAFPNSGGWYDFGFVIGAATFFGGLGHQSHEREKYYALGYADAADAAKEHNLN
jgi:hypothetical protein